MGISFDFLGHILCVRLQELVVEKYALVYPFRKCLIYKF